MKKLTVRNVVFGVLILALVAGITYVVIDSTSKAKPVEKKTDKLIPILTGPEGIVARVGKVDIKSKEYADMMARARVEYLTSEGKDLDDPVNIDLAKSVRKDILDTLIEYAVYQNYALEKNIKLTDDEISKQINDEIDSEISIAGSTDKLEKQLANEGKGGIAQLRQEMKKDPEFLKELLKNKVKEGLKKSVKITEKEAEKFYESKLIGISRIVLWYDKNIDGAELESGGRQAITTIRDMIGTKGTFEEIAQNFSEDTETAKNGGKVQDLFIMGALPADIDNIVWKMKVGEVSQPIQTSDAFMIIRLDFETFVWQYYFPDTVNKTKTPFKKVKNKVADQLYTVRVMEVENQWYNNYKNSLDISIYLKYQNEDQSK